MLGCFLIFQYFQSLKLGRQTPITKALGEGILKVGAKRAGKLENETEHDEWFSSIGDAPMAVDNIKLQRLSTMALLRCFSDILYDQRISETIRQSAWRVSTR